MSTTMNCHFEPVFCHVSDDRRGGFIPAPNRDYGAFEALLGRKQTKQDKGPASPVAGPSDFCPQCGQFWGRGPGVKSRDEKHFWGPGPVQSMETQKNRWGQLPGKERE